MHPLILYDIVRSEHERAAREAEALWHLRSARGLSGRPRRQRTARVARWLRLPVPRVALRGAS
jgi:hypothetical protein